MASDKCSEDLLERPDVGNLNHWLAHFLVKCRRENGMPYPPSSVTNILVGLYCYCKSCGDPGSCSNFTCNFEISMEPFKFVTGSSDNKVLVLR